MTNVKILDGGLGTELEKAGLVDGTEDPLWSARTLITNPESIKTVHKSFLDHGADIIITSTYQASIQGFKEFAGLDREGALELFDLAGRLAREAVDEFWRDSERKGTTKQKPLVAGSLGPYGASLHDSSEYTGEYADKITKQELMDWHRPHLDAIVKSGVDLVAMETIPCQLEAEALVCLLREFPAVKAWISYCVKDDKHICHGETFAAGVRAVVGSEQIIAVGCNCCNPSCVTALLTSAQSDIGTKTFVVYPDQRREFPDGRILGEYKLMHLESQVGEWMELGARYIGGCCQTTPENIRSLSEAVKNYETSK